MTDVDRQPEPVTVATADACHCITCGDIAETMAVVQVDEARALALCADQHGARHSVEILLVDAVSPGDRLLVHAGTAIGPAAA